jgi:outer membrane protein FlgP
VFFTQEMASHADVLHKMKSLVATVWLTRGLFMEKPMTSYRLSTVLAACLLSACQTLPLSLTASDSAAPPAPSPMSSMITPLVEKRETLVATGYAVISVQNHKNPAQQRLLAIRASKLDAYRSLTEQVYGQQLDATTTVADMTVMSDTFRTKVEGVIYGATMVSITPVGEDTYETTLSLDQYVVRDLRALYLGQMASRRR